MNVTFTKCTDFVLQIGLKQHDLQNDTFKMLLSNVTPSAAWVSKSQVTEIAAGNGYVAGGFDIQNTWSLSSGVGVLACVDYLLSASGGSIGPFQYGIIYNATLAAGANNLFGWIDYGTPITVLDTKTCLFDFPANLWPLTW